jgi:broad specificity phosphatase PhoE
VTVTRLFLCRHGEPDETVRGRICGALDPGLSPTGVEQANMLAAALRDVPLAAVYSSPQRRALETAGPVAALHDIVPVEEDGLREIDFGVLEGLTHDEAAARHPSVYRMWMDDAASVRFPRGECWADVQTRVAACLAGILRQHPGGSVAVIAHGGGLRAALAAWLEMPAAGAFRLDQGYGKVTVVDWFGDDAVVRLLNADPALFAAEGSAFSRLYSSP